MSAKKSRLIYILAALIVVNIAATVILAVRMESFHLDEIQHEATAEVTEAVTDKKPEYRYVMYVGTNDKDTGEQIVSTDKAMDIVDKICVKHLEGYTIQDATGSWGDGSGKITHEDSFVCYFYYADEKEVYAIADEVIAALNQSCVLIEKAEVKEEYYYGK